MCYNIIDSCIDSREVKAIFTSQKNNARRYYPFCFFFNSKLFLFNKKIMLAAIILSVFFLISYVCHHLFSGETKFGDLNHDGILSPDEKILAGSLRYVYYFILITHIPLAGIVLPFILFTAYRALAGDYEKHKKLAHITWPLWLYVAISGVAVYLLISPYYS